MRHAVKSQEAAENGLLLARIREPVGERPSYGYRRVTALLNREQTERANPKRIYRIMRRNKLLLERCEWLSDNGSIYLGREIAKSGAELWVSRSGAEKRALLEMMVSNPTLTGRKVAYELKKPFAVLAEIRRKGVGRAP